MTRHTFAQKPNTTEQTASARSTIRDRAHVGRGPEVISILQLQRTIGNQAVLRMLQTHAEDRNVGLNAGASPLFGHDFSRIPIPPPAAGVVQTKLAINRPGDEYEQEADRVSEQVMQMREPQLQHARQTEQPDQEHESAKTTRAQGSDAEQIAAPPAVLEILRSSGQPLDPQTRAFMEPRFGQDFSRVRVHSGAIAEQSARDVNAHAYTVGHNVVFGAGRFAPERQEGRRLLAHELTHTLQQSSQSLTVAPGATALQRSPQGEAREGDAPAQGPASAQKLPWYQRAQLEALEGRIQDWTEDERIIARTLVREWFELRNKGNDQSSVATMIQDELITRYYKPWLQAKDQFIQEYCHKHDLGPRERFGGGISCEPLFTGDRRLGEGEIQSLRSYMKVTGPAEAEPPLNVVVQWVREYRNRTNPEQLEQVALAEALIGLLSIFATPGGTPLGPSGGLGEKTDLGEVRGNPPATADVPTPKGESAIVQGSSTDATVVDSASAMGARTGQRVSTIGKGNLVGVDEVTVVAHANETAIKIGNQIMTPKQLAKGLVESGFEGGTVRLAACKTAGCGAGGKAFAQELSKELRKLGADSAVIGTADKVIIPPGIHGLRGLPTVVSGSKPVLVAKPLGKGWEIFVE